MLVKKVTVGFVIQTYDKDTGKCVGQEFMAGDQVDYEDENGEAVSWQESEYQPFDMIQPE